MTGPASSRYPIAAVRERMRQHAGPVLDFTVGRHREAPPQDVQDLLNDHTHGHLLTPCTSDEIEAFVAAARAMLERVYGLQVPPDTILPVPGGRTAMSFLASTLIGPGDDVAVIEPAYPSSTPVSTGFPSTRTAASIPTRPHSRPVRPGRSASPP